MQRRTASFPLSLAVVTLLAVGPAFISSSANAQETSTEGLSTTAVYGKTGDQLYITSGDTDHFVVFKNGEAGPNIRAEQRSILCVKSN